MTIQTLLNKVMGIWNETTLMQLEEEGYQDIGSNGRYRVLMKGDLRILYDPVEDKQVCYQEVEDV